jgi:hypothetical protein
MAEKESVSWTPVSISFVTPGTYELLVVDDRHVRQTVTCTVHDEDVLHVRYKPDVFFRSLTDSRPITALVIAFHRACSKE